jgi:hypothetical protein
MACRAGFADVFWGLTLWEVNMRLEAWSDNRKDEMRQDAWHAANIMNMWSKKAISPKKLLRGTSAAYDEPKQFGSKAEFDEYMNKER